MSGIYVHWEHWDHLHRWIQDFSLEGVHHCFTSTPINHIVLFAEYQLYQKCHLGWGGGGGRVAHPCTLPLDPPLIWSIGCKETTDGGICLFVALLTLDRTECCRSLKLFCYHSFCILRTKEPMMFFYKILGSFGSFYCQSLQRNDWWAWPMDQAHQNIKIL